MSNDHVAQGPDAPGPADAARDDAGEGLDEAAVEAELLEADLRDLAAERDELRGAAQRIQADFENYRKRVMRDQAALSQRATEQLVESLLPALDAFEMAVVSLGDADEKVRKGVELAVGRIERARSNATVSRASPSSRCRSIRTVTRR